MEIIMFLDRDFYKELKGWKDLRERKPVLIEGARQVGKTALLKYFGEREFPKTYYYNFERDAELHKVFAGDLAPLKIIEDLELRQGEKIDPYHSLIIFDEIQACPRALTSLKYFSEELKGTYIACAGSLLGVTLGSGSFPVGKVERRSMYPLSFREFVRSSKNIPLIEAIELLEKGDVLRPMQIEKLWEMMLDYFCCGGLPEVIVGWHSVDSKLDRFNEIKKIQERIYNDYLADIAKHCGSEKAVHIESVLRNIPSQLARELDGSASKFQFKNVIAGKKSFRELQGPIDWLHRAGLIHQVYIAEKALSPLTAYCKDNRFKLYLFDIGILRHLSSFQPEQLIAWGDNQYKGFYAENFVLNELLAQNVPVPKAWREGDSEIEFLLESGRGIFPLEVKSGTNRRSRSLSVYRERYHPQETYILAGKQYADNPSKGVKTRPLFVVPDVKRSIS
jgi:uncharacterized protein